MYCKLSGMILAAAVCCAIVARGDVFDMGGTRNPITGTWTGLASLEFVTVGNPGNVADNAQHNGSVYGVTAGSVPYVYKMGKYDVTAAQYCEFLNAVAATDSYGLYSSYMQDLCGIMRSGVSGSYTYSIQSGYVDYANFPVNYVSWGDAARFCNWLQNGQPTFTAGTLGEVAGSTETGAYPLNGANDYTNLTAITRNAGATYFIPTVAERYKVAYYDSNKPGGAGYWSYPTKSETAPSNLLSPAGTNNANFYNGGFTDPVNWLTAVGTFAGSPGPYGTYDVGGDLYQWAETSYANARVFCGGCFGSRADHLAKSLFGSTRYPGDEVNGIGFRVASVPEPSSLVMLAGIALTALLYWWRKRA